jgi:hypothetical protein
MTDRPEVSGLSPRSASELGGVKITVRGNNLGKDADDLMGASNANSHVPSVEGHVLTSGIFCFIFPCSAHNMWDRSHGERRVGDAAQNSCAAIARKTG